MNVVIDDPSSAVNSMVLEGLNQAPFAVLIFRPDADLTVVWRNAAHGTLTETEGQVMDNMALFDAFPPSADTNGREAVEAIRESVGRIRQSGAPERLGRQRFDLKNAKGAYCEHHWEILHSPIQVNGEVGGILQTSSDVTAEVLADRLAATRRRAAESVAAISYFSFDPQTDIFDRHQAIDAMFGFEPGEAGEKAAPFFARVHSEDLPGVYAEVERVFAAPPGDIASFDYRVCLPDGGERFLRIRAEVATDPNDRRSKLVGSFIDLTDVETTRRDLSDALAQREGLIQEANHRIKNSLQIALSMLRIEKSELAAQDTDAARAAADALTSFEARINAVSDVHGELQFDAAVTTVSINQLLHRLIESTRLSSSLEEADIRFDPARTDHMVSSSWAINVGLIVNEWLTNALKYGLDAEGRGLILIQARSDGDALHLRIENDIPHKPASTHRIRSSGTGSRLSGQFAAQIGADLEAARIGERYVAEMRCPLSEAQP